MIHSTSLWSFLNIENLKKVLYRKYRKPKRISPWKKIKLTFFNCLGVSIRREFWILQFSISNFVLLDTLYKKNAVQTLEVAMINYLPYLLKHDHKCMVLWLWYKCKL